MFGTRDSEFGTLDSGFGIRLGTRSPLHLDDRRGGPAKDLRGIHLFRPGRRRAERAGCRGPDDVREAVTPLAQTGGKELDAIVPPLDVIEAAVLPPRHPVALQRRLPILLGRE